ncbi:sodium:solute symporter family protein [Ornithinibacillus massiliensis]|uniref:Sodium:solute symporter family protein n=1 Tax=Ornithinibacillus massiliensis TaxID=1944633 RepID=A0ABS5MGK3_9BACI|nr:sodium:solute symporter family protein [Ornithinibacillus massiliensis]MBS3681002.1 sodium:solute symporter family protein [Ornithinibacillus massiliensis]
MNTSFVIWGIIIYIIIASTIALLSRKGNLPGMSGYFIGNRKMNGILSALSYSATTYSAFMMVGLAGLTYQGGVGALGFEIIYFIGVSLILIFGPRFWLAGKKNGYVTPSEMIGDRYQSKSAAIVIALMSCLFLIPYSAVQLAGVGYLLQGMTGGSISFSTGVIIAIALALFFSYAAGIRSVVWTDSLQAIFMIITSTIVVILIVHSLGGFGQFFDNLQTTQPEMLAVPGNGYFSILTFLGLTIPWFFFSISNPQVSQRLFMPNSFKGLRQMLIGFLVFGLIYTFVSVMWGFSALQLFPDLEKADLATPSLLSSDAVPPLLGVIVMVGILAAAVSTIDSIMLTLSSMFARDVYGNMKSRPDDRKQLKVGKIIIPVIAILAYAFAELELDLIAVLSVAASSGLIVGVPAIVGTFFWKRGTSLGVIVSVIVTALLVLYLEATGTKPLGLGSGIWGLIISSVLFIGVSLISRPPEAKAHEFVNLMKEYRKTKKAIE